MHPVFFSFRGFSIYSYGVFVNLAFILSVLYLSYSQKRSNDDVISQDKLHFLVITTMVFGIIGSRLLFVIMHFREFMLMPLSIFNLRQGGLVYYGGFITAAIFIMLYAKRNKIQILKLGDFFAPALAFGHAVGRVGCFFSGCCYGKESTFPWAVVFGNEQGVPLHPTQIYECLCNLLLFVILYFYSKKKRTPGKSLAVYLIFYSVSRFFIEFLRGDFRGEQYLGLSTTQIISIVLFMIGICIICKQKFMKNSKEKELTLI
ncbi:MAG: prolipoprotein diacylglyceryl transferase [Endomicrobium sp.]|jgi:phosphatidylglycerol:prolipoprotein diacylglycerol transferase|nr:prolipoprotein diacylglyceryl transferase [Endomicrobium sp.]